MAPLTRTVWTDLAKFGHPGTTLKNFNHFEWVDLVISKILSLLWQAFSGHSETCLWHQLQLQDYNYLFDRNQRQNVQLSRQQRQLLLESVQQPRLQRRNGQHHFRRTLETSLHANVGYEKRYLLMMMMTISAEAETMSRAHVFENIFASVKNKSKMYVNSVTRLGYFRKVMVNNSLPN